MQRLMLASTCCTPEDVNFILIQLQPVRLHPFGDDTNALRPLRRECIDLYGSAGTEHLQVISVQIW